MNLFLKSVKISKFEPVHLEPEKYQYIFEKYLREELGQTELELFEEKLNQDLEFKKDFEQYKAHRAEILKRELEEYEEPIISSQTPQKMNWLYLLVSVLGIVLVVDYAIHSKDEDALHRPKNIISRSIGLFKSNKKQIETNKSIQTETGIPYNEPSNLNPVSDSITNEQLKVLDSTGLANQPISTNESIQLEEEVFIADSVMDCFRYAAWQDLLEFVSYEVDSVLSDSLMMERATELISKKKQNKLQSITVEYWETANHFKGYEFYGNKLILYGFPTSTAFYLLFDEVKSAHYMIQQNHFFNLVPNNHLHRIKLQ